MKNFLLYIYILLFYKNIILRTCCYVISEISVGTGGAVVLQVTLTLSTALSVTSSLPTQVRT